MSNCTFVAILLLCSCVSVYSDTFSRTLTSSYNPGCETQKQNCSSLFPSPHLLYTKGVSDNNGDDVIHFVVSAGGRLGPLSMLLIHARGENSILKFNWTKLLSDDLNDRKNGIQLYAGRVVFQAGFVVTKLWEYNDTDDSGSMKNVPKNHSLYKEWNTSEFIWTINRTGEAEKSHNIELTANSTSKTVDDMEFPYEDFQDTDYFGNATTVNPSASTEPTPTTTPKPTSGIFSNGGKLQFKITLSNKETRPDEQPRLKFTGNSTQLDVVLDKLVSSFNGSRFGITVVQLNSLSNSSGAMNLHLTKSVDDEFTPGIFKMYDWVGAPKKINSSNKYDQSFLQWKPICYTNPSRRLKFSQQMFSYKPEYIDPSDSDVLQNSLIYALPKALSMRYQNAMNISFGQSQDGFYKASNYITWTTSMGIGKPPTDEISILVILIIVIGLGLPLILIIVGSIYICVRRRNIPVVTYEVIN